MTRRARHLLWGIPLLVALLWIFGLLAGAPAGLPEASTPVRLLLPVVRALADIAAVVTVGCAVMGGLVIVGRSRTVLGWCRTAALVWCGLLCLQTVLTLLDTSALPLAEALSPGSAGPFLAGTGVGQVLVAQTMGALFVALAVGLVHSRAAAWVVASVATGAAAMPGLLGHGGIAAGHIAAAISLALHIAAVCVWVGGLAVLVILVGRRPGTAVTLVPRFSAVALACALVVGESGLLNASLRLAAPSLLVSTDYGSLVLAKAVLFAALVFLGWRQRSRIVPGVVRDGSRGRDLMIRVATWELALMGLAIGASVAMSRMGPPPVIPGAGAMSPLAVVVLALGLPAVLRLVATPPDWGRRAPEVVAVAFLVIVAEVGSLGVVQSVLGQDLGALVGSGLLVGAGWVLMGAVGGGAPWALALVAIGWPFVVGLGVRWSATPVGLKEAVFCVFLAWLIIAGVGVMARRGANESTTPEPVGV